jgi:ABC-type antimicrobial peptide transport system permease subunit
VRGSLRALDAGLPFSVDTWGKEMDTALFAPRAATAALGALGALGVLGALLALTGMFGMAAYSVSRRLRELGIRIAMGAMRMQVLRAALGRVFRVFVVGSVAGVVFGMGAGRLLSFLVYQATPRDPVVLGEVVGGMVLLGLVAGWIPAQRALRLDPLILLREE